MESSSPSSTAAGLLDEDRGKVIVDSYWLGDVNSVVDEEIVRTARWYKKRKLRKLHPASIGDIKEKSFPKGRETIVMVKRDGEYNLLDYNAGRDVKSLFCNAPNSRGRHGLPVNRMVEDRMVKVSGGEEFKLLKALLARNGKAIEAPLDTIRLAGELWADVPDPANKRPRVFDFIRVSRSPSGAADLDIIRFDAFDIVSVNGVEVHDIPYKERLAALLLLFPGKDGLARVVPFSTATTKEAVVDLYEKWVVQDGEEGIVVKSMQGYKVKPVRDVDVVIVGFLEMLEQEKMVSSLLVALMDKDGKFRVLGSVGGGFTDDERRELFSDLSGSKVGSDYIHTSRDGRRYAMVKPERVMQVEYLDTIVETGRGEKVKRATLSLKPDGSWSIAALSPFVSLISPRFKQFRDDKQVSTGDLRLEQLGEDLVGSLPAPKSKVENPSEMLLRVLFLGSYRGSTTLQKYLVWKTNKGASGEYPEYVVFLVSYNFTRAEPLKFVIRPASTAEFAANILDRIARGKDGIISDKTGKLKRGWKRQKVVVNGDAGDEVKKALPSMTRELLLE